jgi:hypothetical protein
MKNDEKGREIIAKWTQSYDETKWNYNLFTGKWSTNSMWAGEDYEQGAFIKYVFDEYKEHIYVTEYYVLNNVSPQYKEESVVAHLAAIYKTNHDLINILFI